MKLKELLEKMKVYTLVHIYNEEGTKIAGMLPENARKYLSILLLESEIDTIEGHSGGIEVHMKEDEPERKEQR